MARCKNVSCLIGGSGGTPGGDGGDNRPHRLTAAEKGKGKKVLAKKRKASDHEAEVARAVAAAAEAAEAGGRSGSLRIGSKLSTAQRHEAACISTLHHHAWRSPGLDRCHRASSG